MSNPQNYEVTDDGVLVKQEKTEADFEGEELNFDE